MPKRLLYSVMILASLAMLLFVAGFVCWQLGLDLLTGLFYFVAGRLMLVAFVVWSVLAGMTLAIALARDLRAFFSREARVLRQVLALRDANRANRQKLFLQARQLRFWAGVKRQRLLEANNRQHFRALFRTVYQQLQAARVQLSAEQYQQLRKNLRDCRQREDVEAMLALSRELSCRD